MANVGSLLSIARTALSAQQVALQAISQNIANAETPGYSRQRADLAASVPQRFPQYNVGTGVDVRGVVRMRSYLLDRSVRTETGQQAAFNYRADLLGEVEEVLGEPSETGLANSLDQFWNAWSDLANNPTSPSSATAQAVVRQRGQQVTNTLNQIATRLTDVASRARIRLSDTVTQVNTLAGQLAELNKQVTAAEVSGQQAPDLRDARDILADKLSGLAGVRVETQANGTLAVYLGGRMLVDEANARSLQVQIGAGGASVIFAGDPSPAQGVGGELGAGLDFLNTDLPAVQARLDDLARGLVNGVNEYHASGWTVAGDALGGANWNPLLGPTGSRVDFFDPTKVTAGSISLSTAVTANAGVIAAGDVQNAPGNNAVAQAIGALRGDAGMAALQARMGASFATLVGFATGESYGDHYTLSNTQLGAQVADARSQLSVHETLLAQAERRRQSDSGVSVDEELALMLKHQQAYTAATRLVRVADEMAQAILGMV